MTDSGWRPDYAGVARRIAEDRAKMLEDRKRILGEPPAGTRFVKVPPRFVEDCLIVKESVRSVTLCATKEQLAELRSRAEFYTDPYGPDGEGLSGLKASARATLTALDGLD